MSTYYVDKSALIKRYLTEPGSEWVREITDPKAGNVIIICDLTAVEFFSAIARRIREETITEKNADVLHNRFEADLEHEYLSVPLESYVLKFARSLFTIGAYPLRSLDAIQLASAIAAWHTLGESVPFVNADKKLLAVADEIFPNTDNPNNHL